MPRLGPWVVNPQKQPEVDRDQSPNSSPNAVVDLLAIALPLSNRREFANRWGLPLIIMAIHSHGAFTDAPLARLS
jgi:hypothetical protein